MWSKTSNADHAPGDGRTFISFGGHCESSVSKRIRSLSSCRKSQVLRSGSLVIVFPFSDKSIPTY
jgi:hypothetical protein